MKTLIVYYSYSGHSKKLAEELAKKEGADTSKIKDARRPGTLKAYTSGCYAAIFGKPWPILPLERVPAGYERIILISPVWANNPPPAVNAFLETLPEGKTVDVKMVSASGKSGCKERVTKAITGKGCAAGSFEDVKA